MSNSSMVNYTRISPNRTVPRKGKILNLIPHHIAGNLTVEACCALFAKDSRDASSTYIIGSDGRVGMACEEKDRPWTTGNQIDHYSVTFEVADDIIDKNGKGWHSSEKALKSLVLLCVDICKRNNIDKVVYTGNKNGNLLMHKWYQNTDCPGDYLESKFPWIASEVNKILAGGTYESAKDVSTESYRPESKGYLIKGDYGQAVKVMQQMLIKCGYDCGESGADASFGNDTEESLKAFQSDNNLKVDGSYGPITKEALTAKYNALYKADKKPNTETKMGKIKVDGKWGTETTRKAQEVFGCKIVDGIVSNQWQIYKNANKGLTTGWDWDYPPNGVGSNLIREIQKFCDMPEKEIDGEIGSYTIMSMQRKFNCKIIDGYFSEESDCIKAFQEWLNEQ